VGLLTPTHERTVVAGNAIGDIDGETGAALPSKYLRTPTWLPWVPAGNVGGAFVR
jgi:hypothetical protein